MQGVAREINPRPGACVCVARWNGDVIYYNPGKYLQHIRGGSFPGKKRGKEHGNHRQHNSGHSLDGDRAVCADVLRTRGESEAG